MSRLLALAVPVLLLAGCASDTPEETVVVTTDPTPTATANAAIAEIAALGESGVSGQVEFIETDGAVEIRYNLAGLPGAGPFGFHVHENGDCGADSTGTPGSAAGGHFNPLASPHGAPDSSRTARHAGDLGNITPGDDGRAVGVAVDSLLSFDGPTSVLGKAVMVHAGRDNMTTDPSGDAGARIGCGVVRAERGAGAATRR